MPWPLLNMYSENFGLGPGGFIIRVTFISRKKGLETFLSMKTRLFKYIHRTLVAL